MPPPPEEIQYSSDALYIVNNEMIMSKKQKEAEDQLFGPFKDMKLEGMPTPEKLWDLICQAGGQVTKQIFSQFMHWLAVQSVAQGSKMYMTMISSFINDRLESKLDDSGRLQLTPELLFETTCEIVDTIVPEVAVILFRAIDHNNDGEISREEWDAGLDFLQAGKVGNMQGMIDGGLEFVFMIIDKNGNRTLENEELLEVISKFTRILKDLAVVILNMLERAFLEASEHALVDETFQALDKDQDEKLTPEELFMGYPEPLLATVNAVPFLLKSAYKSMPVFGLGFETWGAELNKLQFGLLQELSLFKNEARVAWRQVFKDAFVQRSMAFAEWWKEQDLYKKMEEAGLMNIYDSMKIYQDIKIGRYDPQFNAMADAMFELYDADNDGKVSADDIQVFTDFLLVESENPDQAKAKLDRLFGALDISKTGAITKDELFIFFEKAGKVVVAVLHFMIEVLSDAMNSGAARSLTKMIDFYKQWHKAETGETVGEIEFDVFKSLVTQYPRWGMAYAQAVQGDMATMLMGGEPPASEAQEEPADPPAPVVKDKRFYWSSDEAAKVRFETSEPLFSAIEWDQDDKVLQLLADGVDVNAFGSDCAGLSRAGLIGATPLQAAIFHEKAALASALIDAGAKLDQPGRPDDKTPECWRRTALHFACEHGYTEEVKVLLAKGADASSTEGAPGSTPAQIACARDDLEMVQLIAGAGGSLAGCLDIVFTPKRTGNHDRKLADFLESKGCTASVARPMEWSPAVDACRNGDVAALTAALDGGVAVDTQIWDRATLLILAAEAGQLECVKLLLARGANTEARTKRGRTAMHRAALQGHAPVVACLLEAGAIWDAKEFPAPGPAGLIRRTPADLAMENGHEKVVQLLGGRPKTPLKHAAPQAPPRRRFV